MIKVNQTKLRIAPIPFTKDILLSVTGNSYSNKSKLEIKLNVMFSTPCITRKYSKSIDPR